MLLKLIVTEVLISRPQLIRWKRPRPRMSILATRDLDLNNHYHYTSNAPLSAASLLLTLSPERLDYLGDAAIEV
jgi:hypothetical protein